MTATRTQVTATAPGAVLYLAFELGWNEWKLGFATSPAQPVRQRTLRARNLPGLLEEIAKAKVRFGLDPQTPVSSCYEAGRDGFWLHRFLTQQGISNLVVDSSSIEVNRRARRAKTDRLDVEKLVRMLMRYHHGETQVWGVVRVPSPADEDRRQLHRDLLEMKAQRTQHGNRIKGLLASLGIAVEVTGEFAAELPGLRTWDGQAVPPALQQRLRREFERWRLVDRQIRDLENERARRIRTADGDEAVGKVRQLLELRGIGANSAWLYVMEFFAWRQIRNRRQLGALAGLVPSPFTSGDSEREQGISKAGNRRLRVMAIEIAWGWLRFQPHSRLSRWYQARFGQGSKRLRRIGIVALARKLLVALWRFLEEGVVPEGAETVPWQWKRRGRLPQAAVTE
jgi:transposase